ncbi:MAG TPA: zinc ribbon domain-containing protein [Longimicrobiales bacterium]|nr:zinc ribbon domain-containing protein [Longimicrobiales bacterium]
MTEKTCPRCGAAANGNFCASCGASLGGLTCDTCGTQAEPGARFCTGCGSPLGAAAASKVGAPAASAAGSAPSGGVGGASTSHGKVGAQAAGSGGGGGRQIGWWMAGATFVFLLAVVAYPILVPQASREEAPGPTGGAQSQLAPSEFGNANAVDLSSMTPTDAANRLFDRVMTLFEANDTAQVQFFLPMAISAYEQAEPLTPDGLYHLSTLHRLSDDPASALEAAQRILDETPTHLFGLSEAGEASLALGDTAAATEYFQAVLDNWADEQAVARPAYQMHPAVMPTIRGTAEANTGGD